MQTGSSLEKWQAAASEAGETGQELGGHSPASSQLHSVPGLRVTLGSHCPKLPASPFIPSCPSQLTFPILPSPCHLRAWHRVHGEEQSSRTSLVCCHSLCLKHPFPYQKLRVQVPDVGSPVPRSPPRATVPLMINLSLPWVETTHALFSAKHYGCSLQAPLPHQAVPCESLTVADAPPCPSPPTPAEGLVDAWSRPLGSMRTEAM